MYISIMRMIARKRIRNTSGRSLLREPVCHSRRAHLQKEECVMEAFLPLRRCCRGRCLRGLAGQCLLLRYQFICGAGYSGNRSRTAGQDCAARWLYGVAERLFQTDLFIGGVAESTRCTAGGRSDIRCEA